MLCIRLCEKIYTIRSGLFNPFDSMKWVISGMSKADLVRFKLTTWSNVCTTIRKN